MRLPAILSAALLLGTSAPAFSAVIFSDNFNTENGGTPALNFGGFSQWTVSDGTVDLIGSGSGGSAFDFLPGNGLYVDLDGSTSNSGIFVSLNLALIPGNYVLEYSLAGSQRGSTDSVDVSVSGGLGAQSHSLPSSTPFTTFSIPFTIAVADNYSFGFAGTGGDNVGLLLDNVSVSTVRPSSVPEGGTSLTMTGAGLLGLALLRRKMK